ncbi:MAG: hypothetical protein WAQ52_02500 [Terriglobales bacterium]
MKAIRSQTLFVRMLVASSIVLTLALSGAALDSARSGKLHLIKNTSEYTGLPGAFATITESNLAEIPVGSKVFFDQAVDIPTGLLDSNIVLDAGNGNRAVGRCTLDLTTLIGLCTFSDGIGTLAGFHSRLVESYVSGSDFDLSGTYHFASK